MGKFRTILACVIALAVAVAPVAATLLASAGAHAATAAAAAKHDCHGKTQDHENGPHGKAGCPDCQDQDRDYAKCTGDGSKCCKLTGVVTVLPVVAAPLDAVILATNPPTLIGWQIRPSPPPPRA